MTIRPLQIEDAVEVHTLLNVLGGDCSELERKSRIAQALVTDGQIILVAEKEGKMVGVVHAFMRVALEKPREVVVQALAVSPDEQRSGVGQALMEAVEDWALSNDARSVALHTQKASDFYEKLGYKVLASPKFLRKALG